MVSPINLISAITGLVTGVWHRDPKTIFVLEQPDGLLWVDIYDREKAGGVRLEREAITFLRDACALWLERNPE